MEQDTFRSRVAQLIQKSRKAVRLYSGMEKLSDGEYSEYTGLQLEQWQQVNTELLRSLSSAIDNPNSKQLAAEIFAIRDRFYSDWRSAEREVKVKQRELISVGEKGDFVRAAVLGRALVALKAREQAAQAAHHELHEVIGKSRITNSSPDSLHESVEVEVAEEPPPAPDPKPGKSAKIIHLRSRQGGSH